MKSLVKKYHDRLVQEAKKKEADRILDEALQKRAKYYDITCLYTLHTMFGFGKDRCRKYYLGMISNFLGMVKQWQCNGDDSHFWIMEERLKAAGIDVDELIREGHKMAEEDENEQNT